ncbi:hypothetical protein GJU40_17810 [Bacillus lacus]|uniref:Lipoprotein n=1 Tax=Metabacillus lacus TaxID=1983721 RepID=A0A7X2J290_9BACI|nr:hypothetical protein [Metabacillus lacus]MRX73989.1 hypothetical protein [Metabacillus lacus]
MKLKPWVPFSIVIIMMLLTGCNSTILNLEGSTDNWDAKIQVTYTEDREDQSFVLKYQGDKLDEVKNTMIDYEIDSRTGSSRGKAQLSKGGVLQSSDGDSCTGCAKLYEDDEVEFKVMWNGQEEIIVLSKK